MRINEIKDRKVNATLNADELVCLTNLMYFYERYYKDVPDAKELNETYYNLSAQIILASNVCQYGHMDDFASSRYVKHKVAANPNGDLGKIMREVICRYAERDE